METLYICSECKSTKTVNEPSPPSEVLCGVRGCEGTSRPKISNSQCTARRSGSWGVFNRCSFDIYHAGPHSWAVDL